MRIFIGNFILEIFSGVALSFSVSKNARISSCVNYIKVFCFLFYILALPVVYISLFEIPPPSSLECLLQILVIIYGASSLVEVWVIIAEVVFPPLEMGWSYCSIVVQAGILFGFYLFDALRLH